MDSADEIYIKIPRYRVGALIGRSGSDKKSLENMTLAKIDVDSSSGDVTIDKNKADPFTFYRLEHVVKAIGRGFSPMHAKLLLSPDYYFEVIDLKEEGIKSDKSMENKKGRVIGTGGSIRKLIEDSFDCLISVQGKTISIIAKMEDMQGALNAVESLLSGMNIVQLKKQIQKSITIKKESRVSNDF